jgi:nucleotide-binding universal stress UspA family protein
LASDGSAASRHASAVVGQFAWPAGTVGQVLTVLERPLAGQIPQWLEDRLSQEEAEALGLGHFDLTADEQQRIRDNLTRWCGELPAAFQEQPPLVTVGNVRQEIIKAITSQRADLVVVGAYGKGAVGRLLLGSTSEHLLMHAPCSILIVRQHETP